MMTPNRLSAKFFFDTDVSVKAADLIPVFHDWISRQAVEETLIDVADYSHVHQGPALMLVALEADYVLDEGSGASGIRYIRKRTQPDSLASALALVVAQAAQAGHLIASSGLTSGVTLDTSQVEIEMLDKLHFPDELRKSEALENALQEVGLVAFGDAGLTVEYVEQDQRRPLKLLLKNTSRTSLQEVSQRLKQSALLSSVYEAEVVG